MATTERMGVAPLAALDFAARAYVEPRALTDAGKTRADLAAEIGEARAAVAELVEAATRANGDHSAPHDCYATGPLTGDPYRDLVECPGCRLRAALSPFSEAGR